MESRRLESGEEEIGPMRRGWKMGAEDFVSHLLDRIEGGVGENHRAEERMETEEEKAERIVTGELKRCRMKENDLALLRKGDPRKVAIARRLRQETTMTLKWIAERLRMGTWTYVSNLIYHATTRKSVNNKD